MGACGAAPAETASALRIAQRQATAKRGAVAHAPTMVSKSADGPDQAMAATNFWLVFCPLFCPLSGWPISGGAWISGATLLRLGTSDSSGTAAGVAALSAGARRPALVAAMTATSSSWRLRASDHFYDGL